MQFMLCQINYLINITVCIIMFSSCRPGGKSTPQNDNLDSYLQILTLRGQADQVADLPTPHKMAI